MTMGTIKRIFIALAILAGGINLASCSSADDEPTEWNTYSKIEGTWVIDGGGERFVFIGNDFTHQHDGISESGRYAFNPDANRFIGEYSDGRTITMEITFQDATHATFNINAKRIINVTKQ